jgi:hypothetical protein
MGIDNDLIITPIHPARYITLSFPNVDNETTSAMKTLNGYRTPG